MKSRFLLLTAILYFALTVILLTLPGSAFPQENFFSKIYFDKWVHIGMFGLLVFIWNFWVYKRLPRTAHLFSFRLVSLLALGYGLLMEFVQGCCISNRSADMGDFMADAVGCGIAFYISWRYWYKK